MPNNETPQADSLLAEAHRLVNIPVAFDLLTLRTQVTGLQIVIRDLLAHVRGLDHAKQEAADEIEKLRTDLKLNAGMLARQCDLAREAELALSLAQQEIAKLTKRKRGVAERFEAQIGPLTAIAREHGYALGVHGSLERDIDLIAAPWTDDASAPDVLIEAIRQAVDGYIRNDPHHDAYDETATNPAKRPHGRLAWCIYPATGVTYYDISVMPRESQRLASLEAEIGEIAQQMKQAGCHSWDARTAIRTETVEGWADALSGLCSPQKDEQKTTKS